MGYIVLLSMGCDAVQPSAEPRLVVEGYVQEGEPLPVISLRQTLPMDQPYSADAAVGAQVQLSIGDTPHAYTMTAPGVYEPQMPLEITARAQLHLDVTWDGVRASATTHVPPALTLDEVSVRASKKPLSGLILDSLFIDRARIDTLNFDSLSTGASAGFVYLVEVTLEWEAVRGEGGDYWIRTQLQPYLESRTRLDDYFLRPEDLHQESLIPQNTSGQRAWTGIYAVPVEAADSVLPRHRLRVALVRGTQAYAQFVSGSDSPKYREPISNVTGALGIFAGISVDSLSLQVE